MKLTPDSIKTRLKIFSLFTAVMLTGSAVAGVPLQVVYDSAGSGEGYNKLLVLDPAELYTGGLEIGSGVSCCIHGNGASLDLDQNSITASGSGTVLDMDHCALYNGWYGIEFYNNASGYISLCTITDNAQGIAIDGAGNGAVLLEGNNICFNATFGVAVYDEISYPEASYNNTWGNTGGNYMYFCPG